MICILTAPIDLANYMEVYNIRKRRPQESVSHINWADFSKMRKSETLYLLAHGSRTKVEDRTPEQLASELLKKGLGSIKKIKLVACASGVTAPGPLPFCQRLADEIVKQGGPALLVVGFDGVTTVTDEAGRSFANDTLQSTYKDYSEFQRLHKSHYEQWDKIAENMKFLNPAEILHNVAVLEPQVQQAFKWLHANNRQYIKPSIVGKTYGIPGQRFPGRP